LERFKANLNLVCHLVAIVCGLKPPS